MKELDLGLTNQAEVHTLGKERQFMQQGPDRPEGGGTATIPRTPGEAADRVEEAARRAQAPRATGLEGLTPQQIEKLRRLAERLEEEGEDLPSREGVPKSVLTSREARDKFFNELFNVVDSKPHEFFERAFNPLVQGIQYDTFTRILLQASRARPGEKVHGIELNEQQIIELKEDLARYEVERRVREYLHNVNAILYLPSIKADQLFDQMQQFESQLGDVAFMTPGVVEMMNIYEEELRAEMARNGGYLKPEAITGTTTYKTESAKDAQGNVLLDDKGNVIVETVFTEVKTGVVEEHTKKRFKEHVAKYGLTARDKDGKLVTIKKYQGGREPEGWEVDGTFIRARAMMIMSERLLSIAAEGKMAEGLGKYSSLFLQDILQSYSPYRHLIGKYSIAETGLVAYLHKPDDVAKRFLGLGIWNPDDLNKTWERFNENELAILDSASEFFYLAKENPNRVGDIFTWMSWRFVDDPDIPSGIKDFLKMGRERMGIRWNRTHSDAPTAQIYEEFINREEFDIPRSATSGERKAIKDRLKDAWAAANPGTPSIETYERFVNEYGNWIGTALRFERLRGGIYLGKEEVIDEAKAILRRMIELQPHRLYLKSEFLQKRINQRLGYPDPKRQTQEQKEAIDRTLKNLSYLERAFLKERERLLDEGKNFETISLEEFLQRGDIVSDTNEQAEVRNFMRAFTEDFNENGEKYFEEFIYKREYRHGFVLWSGDAPLDEFNMSALGPTAGFARRARDNKEQASAVPKELELLENLRNIHEPDEVVKALFEIYKIHTHYDASKAKANMAEKAEGIAKFFAERTITKIPVLGFLERVFGEKTSFAKMVYGKEAVSWDSAKTRLFFDQLKGKLMITPEAHKKLTDHVAAKNLDVGLDIGVLASQLVALAIILYMLERIRKEK